jgi:hypothetical protein
MQRELGGHIIAGAENAKTWHALPCHAPNELLSQNSAPEHPAPFRLLRAALEAAPAKNNTEKQAYLDYIKQYRCVIVPSRLELPFAAPFIAPFPWSPCSLPQPNATTSAQFMVIRALPFVPLGLLAASEQRCYRFK